MELEPIGLQTEELPLVGAVTVAAGGGRVCMIWLNEPEGAREALERRYPGRRLTRGEAACSNAFAQLREYLAGSRRGFDLPLAAGGTPFQLRVWEALQRIPYGETRSYAQIAAAIGRPSACRAVGAANGSNPLCIVVPCHRVIGAGGALTGYGPGLRLKKALLELEAQALGELALAQQTNERYISLEGGRDPGPGSR